MKTKLLFVLALIGAACSEDSTRSKQSEVKETAMSGTWAITYYFDDTDETSDYAGYTFTFGASNVITATNGTNIYTGTWTITDSNSSDDSIDDLDFNIVFTAPPDFEELSDDWDIVEVTDTKIELIDISGGGGGTDYLTFEKN